MKIRTLIDMDHRELDSLVTEHMSPGGVWSKFESVAYFEWGNDEVHPASGINGTLSKSDMTDAQALIDNGDAWPTLETILNWLCKEGHIPAGDYFVSVRSQL